MITQETAGRIWQCYSEIQTAEKLIADIERAISEGTDPNPRDTRGRQRGFELGAPITTGGHRLFEIAPRLALSVIRAHVAEKQRELVEANEQARIELNYSRVTKEH